MEYRALPSGTTLKSRFRIEHELGCGSFGRTYLAADQDKFDISCTIKQLRIEDNTDDQLLTKLFHREARQLFLLGKHDSIPEFLGYFKDDGCHYLAYEYVEGSDLASLIKNGHDWSSEELKQLWSSMLLALEYIHKLGLVHRDIKPSNIIKRSQGQSYALIDFGASVLQPAEHGTLIGTPGYAPLRQLAQGIAGPESDLHALAMTVIHLLTAQSPGNLFAAYGPDLRGSWHQSIRVPDVDADLIFNIDRALLDQLAIKPLPITLSPDSQTEISERYSSSNPAAKPCLPHANLTPVFLPERDQAISSIPDAELPATSVVEGTALLNQHEDEPVDIATTLDLPEKSSFDILKLSHESVDQELDGSLDVLENPTIAAQSLKSPDHLVNSEQSPLLEQWVQADPNCRPIEGSIKKEDLRLNLAMIYGPMVDMLLQHHHLLIEPADIPSLQRDLVTAGLARDDVEEACKRAVCGGAHLATDQGADIENRVIDTTTTPFTSQHDHDVADPERSEVLRILRQAIGPVADLIWSLELELACCEDISLARPLLEQASIPVSLVDQILVQLGQLAPRVTSSQTQLTGDPFPDVLDQDQSTYNPRSGSLGAAQHDGHARDLLMKTVGPIGETIWEQVSILPPDDLPQALLALLQGYGLKGELLDEIRIKLSQ